MFNNFLKKFKISVLFLKSNLLFFIKFNYILNAIFVITIYFCISFISINEDILIYSFLSKFFYFINTSYSLILLYSFYFLISIRAILYLNLKNFLNLKDKKINLGDYQQSNKNFNNIFLSSIYYFFTSVSLKVTFAYLYNWILSHFFFNLNNLFIIKFALKNLNSLKPLSWYPIFKRHSIFGYYRINRQRWVELKSEEINYIKY